jgi:hypothetical protein
LACEHLTSLWLHASASILKHLKSHLGKNYICFILYTIVRALDWQKNSKLVVLLLHWLLVSPGTVDAYWILFNGIILVRRIVPTSKFSSVFCGDRYKGCLLMDCHR